MKTATMPPWAMGTGSMFFENGKESSDLNKLKEYVTGRIASCS